MMAGGRDASGQSEPSECFWTARMLRGTGLWLPEDQGQDECEHHDARDGVNDDPDQCAAVAP
jgi:hypothetical protein